MLCYAVDLFSCQGGASRSFILSAREMNHRCNLIRLPYPQCVTAPFVAPVLALLVDCVFSQDTHFTHTLHPINAAPRLVLRIVLSAGERIVISVSLLCCFIGRAVWECVRARMYTWLMRVRVWMHPFARAWVGAQ